MLYDYFYSNTTFVGEGYAADVVISGKGSPRLILPQASPTQSSIPNGAAIAGGIAAAIAITIIAAFRDFRR